MLAICYITTILVSYLLMPKLEFLFIGFMKCHTYTLILFKLKRFMKKLSLISFVLLFFVLTTQAQKFKTNTGKATFTSSNYTEIKGENGAVKAALDLSTGKLVVSMNIQGFQFDKGAMRKHFNTDMNSAKYPSAKFVGTVSGYSKLKKSGTYTLNTTGTLTMRGVSKKKTFKLNLTVSNGKISGQSTFPVNPADFKYGAKGSGAAYATRKPFQSKAPKTSVTIKLDLKK